MNTKDLWKRAQEVSAAQIKIPKEISRRVLEYCSTQTYVYQITDMEDYCQLEITIPFDAPEKPTERFNFDHLETASNFAKLWLEGKGYQV